MFGNCVSYFRINIWICVLLSPCLTIQLLCSFRPICWFIFAVALYRYSRMYSLIIITGLLAFASSKPCGKFLTKIQLSRIIKVLFVCLFFVTIMSDFNASFSTLERTQFTNKLTHWSGHPQILQLRILNWLHIVYLFKKLCNCHQSSVMQTTWNSKEL